MRVLLLAGYALAIRTKTQEALQTHWSQLSEQIDQSNSTIAVSSFLKWENELYQAYNETIPDEAGLKSLVARGSSLNLRVMVAVYAPEKIDKLTGYGCYCFPEAHEKLKGQPLDSVDTLCRRLVWGHKCLEKDYGQCNVAQTAYQWKKEKNTVVCLDPEGTCAGEICRLDKAFAEELNEIWEWSQDLEVSSGFKREDACVSSSAHLRSLMRKEDLSPAGMEHIIEEQNHDKSQCCGQKLNRVLFKPDKFDCCKDGTVARLGQC